MTKQIEPTNENSRILSECIASKIKAERKKIPTAQDLLNEVKGIKYR